MDNMDKLATALLLFCIWLALLILFFAIKNEVNCVDGSTCQLKRDCIIVEKSRWRSNTVMMSNGQMWVIHTSWTTTYNCNWVLITR